MVVVFDVDLCMLMFNSGGIEGDNYVLFGVV